MRGLTGSSTGQGTAAGVDRPRALEAAVRPDRLERQLKLFGNRRRDPALEGGAVEDGAQDAGRAGRLAD